MTYTLKTLSAVDPGGWNERRRRVLEQALALPVPGKPDEVWRRIDLAKTGLDALPFAAPDFVQASYTTGDPADYEEFAAKFETEASALEGRYLGRANEIWDNLLFSAAEAMADKAVYIAVPDGESITLPARTVCEVRSDALTPLTAGVETGKRSRAVVAFCGPQAGHVISNIRVIVGEDSELTLILNGAYETSFTNVECLVRKGGRLVIESAAADSKFDMRRFRVFLAGQESSVKLTALSRAGENDRHVVQSAVSHQAPRTESEAVVKTVLRDQASALFRGTIQITKDAPGSKGFEENRNLVLSRTARAETLPELEIAVDDVECSHAASVSDIDPYELFYLQSRGLERDGAEALIERSFYRDAMGRMTLFNDKALAGCVPAALLELARGEE